MFFVYIILTNRCGRLAQLPSEVEPNVSSIKALPTEEKKLMYGAGV